MGTHALGETHRLCEVLYWSQLGQVPALGLSRTPPAMCPKTTPAQEKSLPACLLSLHDHLREGLLFAMVGQPTHGRGSLLRPSGRAAPSQSAAHTSVTFLLPLLLCHLLSGPGSSSSLQHIC